MAQRFCVAAALAALLITSAASNSDAGWGWFGGSGGSYGGSWGSYGGGCWGGSYGSYGGGCWGGSYGSYGGCWGGSGGWRHGHRSYYSSYGSYGGSYGSYGGYSYSSYGSGGYSSYGSAGYAGSYVTYSQPDVVYSSASYCAPASNIVYSSPVTTDDCCGGTTAVESSYESAAPVEMPYSVPSESIESPEATMPEGDKSASGDSNTALLSVNVPQDAVVYVNGYRTKSTGQLRRFLSAGLNRGDQYAYEVRAVANRNGREVAATRTVTLSAGRSAAVSFDELNMVPDVAVTTLKLHVPEDAHVTLAGQETAIKGATRVFRTDRLGQGESWKDYTIRVTVVRDGEEITRERMATIKAGETHEMSFLVDEEMLAAR